MEIVAGAWRHSAAPAFGSGELSPDELMRRADGAVHRAKESKATGAGYKSYSENQQPTLEDTPRAGLTEGAR